MCKLLTTERLM